MFAFAPGDWESAEWMCRRSGEHDVRMPSASESEDGRVSVNYSIQRERLWRPEDILGLPPYHGLVWFHGRARPVPVYAPPYWRIPECKRLARPDPFHDSDGDDGGGDLHDDVNAILDAHAAAKGRRDEIRHDPMTAPAHRETPLPAVVPDHLRTPPPARKGFWAELRESFARGRDGRPWRDR